MENKNRNDMELSFDLPDADWDNVQKTTEECPGVFYLSICRPDSIVCRELYAVTPSAVPEIISEEAITYGNKIGNIYFFEYDIEHSGWHLIQYEIMRYKCKHGIQCYETQSLYGTAAFATEQYPEYFGETIPPRCTPWGLVVRYKKAVDGVYFLETDRCEWVLALSFPVWSVGISEDAKQFGSFCEVDKRMNQEEAEYLYFQRNKCAPPIFELLQNEDYTGIRKFIVSQEVLENVLYKETPFYVIAKNLSEVAWLKAISTLLEATGEKTENEQLAEQAEKNYIHLRPDLANQELLKLPK